jgi:hypothetical protein
MRIHCACPAATTNCPQQLTNTILTPLALRSLGQAWQFCRVQHSLRSTAQLRSYARATTNRYKFINQVTWHAPLLRQLTADNRSSCQPFQFDDSLSLNIMTITVRLTHLQSQHIFNNCSGSLRLLGMADHRQRQTSRVQGVQADPCRVNSHTQTDVY